MTRYIKSSDDSKYYASGKYYFDDVNSIEELDNVIVDEIHRILKDWDTDGNPYWYPNPWDMLNNLPSYLREVSEKLEKLEVAYYDRYDDLEYYAWVYVETPIDQVIEYTISKDYVEVVGRAGGDTLTYRRYNDGRVVER